MRGPTLSATVPAATLAALAGMIFILSDCVSTETASHTGGPRIGQPLPSDMAAKPREVAQCLAANQHKADYNDIRGKYLFDGPPPASALKNKSSPNAHEQDVLKSWAAASAACTGKYGSLIEYLAVLDPTYRTAFDIYQDRLTETLQNLYENRISYGVALKMETAAHNDYIQDIAIRDEKYHITLASEIRSPVSTAQ